MPKPRVERGGKEHGTKTNKKGGESKERSMEHAKLAAPQPQQPTHLLQVGETHAEMAGAKHRTPMGEDGCLWAHVCQGLVTSAPRMS